ncbi:FAD-dependent oxidoreductase [Bacillus velezensis]|uniref:FAD-dependent oxidoreductase n=1 Tax=Bacillus amyloliquefaciens group TaxID=1938374 RepID=UPI000458864A|nr:FAD-dependent oxidoreductase [Bacillus velezensis]AIW36606.1 oxidoreductase [Bacillus subtilis]AHZ14709.1 3-(3-hydroxy-phenyl)propionate/3-hydroxycinnamic acid hydroxylase 3-HPP hydroxylase [Bacillus velezensis SQR9]AWD13154.1 oxidoreductase [Bacillus velezensis]MDH2303366.1 FAD-dependent oxidoreductase [Bacillus velezensis]MDR4962117.1 FAD-dependent oxidoreductase [Bacillus velezensis]
MNHEVKKIIIAGGGIGGLSAAISLGRAVFEVTLCEAASDMRKSGAGILQPQNALRMLREIGVYDECCQHGFQTEWLKQHDENGTLQFKVSEAFLDDSLPGRNNILRQTLNDILKKHAEAAGVTILLGKKVVSYEETADDITVHCADGTAMTADILAGFDGIRSAVRDQMLQREVKTEYLGMGAHRFYISFPEPIFHDSTLMYKKGQTQVGVVPLSEKTGYVFIIRPYDADFRDDEDTRFERVKDLLRGIPGVKFVTENMSKEYPVLFHKIEQMAVKEPWHRGRVVLGGDAVHAGAPTLAQGAAMAIEDAIVLSEELQKHENHETACQAYFERRAERALPVQNLSSEIVRREIKGTPGVQDIISECYRLLKEPY